MICEKVTNFEFSKFDLKGKLFPVDRVKFGRVEDHNPWEDIFSFEENG